MKKVAIIGAGQVAEKVHANYYISRKNDLELCAVVDPQIERGEKFCERTGFKRSYTDIQEMLDKEKPDIISICTPNRFHFEAVMSSLDQGASVICEKPPAMTPEEARLMSDKAKEKNVILAYDFQHRFSLEADFLKSMFDQLGEVYYTEANALRRSGVPGWGTFIDKEIQGGGPLIDYGIHMLDTALYLLAFPKIKHVMAHSFQKIGTKKNSGKFGEWDPSKFTVEDALFGTITFENDNILKINTSFVLNIKEDTVFNVSFSGDRAGASLYPAEIYEDKAGDLILLGKLQAKQEDKHWRSMDNFVERVLGDDSRMIADGEQGYIIQKVVAALYESAETGGIVKL